MNEQIYAELFTFFFSYNFFNLLQINILFNGIFFSIFNGTFEL